jgi:hypothetical protein
MKANIRLYARIEKVGERGEIERRNIREGEGRGEERVFKKKEGSWREGGSGDGGTVKSESVDEVGIQGLKFSE